MIPVIGAISTALVVLFIVGVGLSLLGALLTPKPKLGKPKENAATALSEKGTVLQYVIGEMLVFPAFVAVYDRTARKEKAPGGGGGKGFGGGGSQDQTIFYERGVHALAINGPASRLRTIRADGKVIWKGDISRTSSPSGSSHSVSETESFTIYWGEKDQVLDTALAASEAFGVNSGFPNTVMVFWNPKRLGTSAGWPNLSYEVTVPVVDPNELTESKAWLDNSIQTQYWATNAQAASHGLNKIYAVYTEQTNLITGDVDKTFFNNPALDSGYSVAVSSTINSFTGTRTLEKAERPGFEEGVALLGKNNMGPNPAHVLWQILTSPAPHGIGISKTEIDKPSIEALGVLMENEVQTASFMLTDGVAAKDAVTDLIVDMSTSLPLVDTKLTAVPMRKGDSVVLIPAEDIVGTLPEKTYTVGPRQIDRTIFTFVDREERYKQGDLVVDADVHAFDSDSYAMGQTQIKTVNNGWAATNIANRRQLEEYASVNLVTFKVHGNSKNTIIPGQLVSVPALGDGVESTLRVLNVKKNPTHPEAEVEAILDPYSLADSFLEDYISQTSFTPILAENDLYVDLVPVWTESDTVGFWVMRARAGSKIVNTDLYISTNNRSYQLVETEYDQEDTFIELTGGEISSQERFISLSPVFTYTGDVSVFNDLSSADDAQRWLTGEQVVILGTEVFFFQKVIPVTSNTVQFSGMARAKKGTSRLNHPVGTGGWAFLPSTVKTFNVPMYSPTSVRWIKSAARSFSGVLDLSETDAFEIQPLGQALLSPGVVNLKVNYSKWNLPNQYSTGANLDIQFNYKLLNDLNAAGEQSAGDAIANVLPDPQGSFTISMTDGVSTLTQTINPSAPLTGNYITHQFTNAEITSTFGSEPSTIIVSVLSTRGNFQSNISTVIVELI